MASLWLRSINRLLPFATPGTPLLQDLIHLGVLCVLLYFAPQIQEHLQRRSQHQHEVPEAVPIEAQDPPEAHQHGVNADIQHGVDGGDEDGEVIGQDPNPANDGPPNADFEAFQRDQINDVNGAGPADPAAAANLAAQRNVGAKKAKSLARRDQRRAYHEFQRAQGEAQRARDAEGAAEREAALAAEKERRRAVEAELEAKKAREREKKKEQDRKEREEELSRRERAVALVKRELAERKMCNVFDVVKHVGGTDVDELWVERILNANGLLGKRDDGSFTMITGTGWIVKVTSDDMRTTYQNAAEQEIGDENGRISYEELGGLLEQVLKKNTSIAAH